MWTFLTGRGGRWHWTSRHVLWLGIVASLTSSAAALAIVAVQFRFLDLVQQLEAENRIVRQQVAGLETRLGNAEKQYLESRRQYQALVMSRLNESLGAVPERNSAAAPVARGGQPPVCKPTLDQQVGQPAAQPQPPREGDVQGKVNSN